MIPARHRTYTGEQMDALRKARRISYVSIAYIASLCGLVYLVMGDSQAMKSILIEDMLSMLAPTFFLIGSHIGQRRPNERFPYGYYRVGTIAFFAAALALLSLGALILVESTWKLIIQEHPTVGMKEVFGHGIWLGWLMIAVLLYELVPPVILGRIKMRHARALHDKTLYTDAQTNKADWLTASAGIVGVLGIGMGWWWADPLAAIFISLDIVKDGYTQTRGAITDLMDRRPETIEGKTDPLPYQVRDFLARQPGVREVEIRFREHGHLLFGEAFLLTDPAQPFTAEEITRLSRETCQLHWRLAEVAITLRVR